MGVFWECEYFARIVTRLYTEVVHGFCSTLYPLADGAWLCEIDMPTNSAQVPSCKPTIIFFKKDHSPMQKIYARQLEWVFRNANNANTWEGVCILGVHCSKQSTESAYVLTTISSCWPAILVHRPRKKRFWYDSITRPTIHKKKSKYTQKIVDGTSLNTERNLSQRAVENRSKCNKHTLCREDGIDEHAANSAFCSSAQTVWIWVECGRSSPESFGKSTQN